MNFKFAQYILILTMIASFDIAVISSVLNYRPINDLGSLRGKVISDFKMDVINGENVFTYKYEKAENGIGIFKDSFGNAVKWEMIDNKLTVKSAGCDGVFGTGDDIKFDLTSR